MLDQLVAIVIAAFACFRVAELIAIDEGPFGVFLRVRENLGGYDLAENGEPRTLKGRMIICPYCLAIYAAFAAALLFDRTLTFPLTWLAIAGGQAFLQTIGGRHA